MWRDLGALMPIRLAQTCLVLLLYSRTACGLVFPRDRLDVHFVVYVI